ncbi:MAG: transposase [Dehalococcoidia bacterium]
MPDYRRAYIKGGTFFFTVVTNGRCPTFSDKTAVDLLKASFRRVMLAHPFKMDSIVVLPDHFHCIWMLPENDSDFSMRWRLIKSDFSRNYLGSSASIKSASRQMKKERGIWQRRFWEHMIRDKADLNTHRDYIHYNPVKHGLVDSPAKWEYSSFNSFMGKGLYPADWGSVPRKELLEMDLE